MFRLKFLACVLQELRDMHSCIYVLVPNHVTESIAKEMETECNVEQLLYYYVKISLHFNVIIQMPSSKLIKCEAYT